MKEASIRKWHRNLGIFLALFIFIQASSGLVLSLGDISTPHEHTSSLENNDHHHTEGSMDLAYFIGPLHHGGETLGALYRILISIGMMVMAITGSVIFFKVRARTGSKRSKVHS